MPTLTDMEVEVSTPTSAAEAPAEVNTTTLQTTGGTKPTSPHAKSAKQSSSELGEVDSPVATQQPVQSSSPLTRSAQRRLDAARAPTSPVTRQGKKKAALSAKSKPTKRRLPKSERMKMRAEALKKKKRDALAQTDAPVKGGKKNQLA